MKLGYVAAAMAISSLFACSSGVVTEKNAEANSKPHWEYSGHAGPEYWGDLSPAFSTCSSGKNQSPVNLTEMVEGELSAIDFRYIPGGKDVLNNGHTIQVSYSPGSTISVDGHEFELKQFHFHTPSENTIEGASYPMEGHFVHADENGNLAVVALMFEEGEANSELQKAWAELPMQAGGQRNLSTQVDAASLLPVNRDYYRFTGSLTTPPCSEGVWWLVLKQSQTASKQQLAAFADSMQHDNNRPLQPINARLIIK